MLRHSAQLWLLLLAPAALADGLPPEEDIGLAVAVGALPMDVVDQVVRRGAPDVEVCYRTRGNQQSGVVMLGWSIGADGLVADAVVTSTTVQNEALEACLVAAVERWRFPAADPSGVTTASYPFVLGDADPQLVSRPLPRRVVEALVTQRADQVRACSTSAGTVEISWFVAPSGHVAGLRVVDSTWDASATRCAADIVAGWRFPPTRSKRSVRVSFPFVLEAVTSTPPGLSGEAIQAVIDAGQGALLACYQRELEFDPALAGAVEVTWKILPQGGVAEARITKQTLRHQRLEDCLLGKITDWRFPASGGTAVDVSYPFTFESL